MASAATVFKREYRKQSTPFRCAELRHPPNRSRIAVITWSNRTHTYRPVEKVVCGYCIRHGYDRVVSQAMYETPLPLNGVQWQRIPFMLDVVQHYEAVLHIDDDSVIAHLEYPVESLLAAYPTREYLLSAVEVNGRKFQGSPKTSTMILKNTPFVRGFLRRFLTGDECAPFRNSTQCCREQDCLWQLMSRRSKSPIPADERFGVISSIDLDCRGDRFYHSKIQRGKCTSPFVWHGLGTPGWPKWQYIVRKAAALLPIAERIDWMAGRIRLLDNFSTFSSGRTTPQLLHWRSDRQGQKVQ
jgi:hypothetical protein